jgi:hypothetical protein
MLFSSTSFLKNTCLLALLGILAACSTPGKNSPVMAGKLQASWVVLGEQGQAVARAVTTDISCPSLLQDGVAQRMNVRAKAETIAQRKTVSISADSKASQFPVLTCEAILNSGVASASIEGIPLPLPKPSAQKIIVIGDTGCRMKKADHYYQACNDTDQWAFEEVIRTAASFKPDLVIHVGDFHYRENACAQGSADCAGSPWGYGWDTWQADFFAPAAPLLAVAPWVMVRGNHESCVRAGQGWWRFMDPRPLEPGRDCNLERDDTIGDYSAPYAIPLGPVAGAAAQLIVFDSARVPVRAMASTDSAYQLYAQQLKLVDSLAEQADFSIFINHHPILGFAPGYLPGNAALQDIMKNRHPQRLFPAKVQVTLAGHVHLFEAITFASDHPTQFVSGNGGSSLDTPLSMPRPDNVTPYSGAQIAHFSNTNEVGFMTMERVGKSWKMAAWDQRGKRLTSCMMQDRKTLCQDEK